MEYGEGLSNKLECLNYNCIQLLHLIFPNLPKRLVTNRRSTVTMRVTLTLEKTRNLVTENNLIAVVSDHSRMALS